MIQMKQIFEEPVVEVVNYTVDDVIATSPFQEEDHLTDLD